MPTSLPNPAPDTLIPTPQAAAPRRKPPSWLREPLLHFVLLGALLFGADHLLSTREDDPATIVVGQAVVDDAKKLFRASRGRDPDAAELRALTQRWIDNEVLYREGVAMRVDQGDTMIRDRVIFKALMVVQTGIRQPPVDDAALRAWFETQRARYDEPMRFDFQEAVLPADSSEATLRAFAQTLNGGGAGAAPGSEAQASLRVFKGRPQANLVQSYGADFASALEAAPVGEWRVLPTREGPRLMRLEALTPGKPAVFEALRNVVLPDWIDATMAQLRTDAVRVRAAKYRIRHEGSAP